MLATSVVFFRGYAAPSSVTLLPRGDQAYREKSEVFEPISSF